MTWFRAYADMIDDEKLRLLAFEDRWHFVAILCCKRSGLLDKADTPEMLLRKLAVKLGLQLRELEAVAVRLSEVGLIDAKTFQPLGWASRQFESDSSTERSRVCRAKKKQGNTKRLGSATQMQRCSDVAATPPETDTESDTEKQCTLRVHAETSGARSGPRCPVNEIVELYHNELPQLPRCTKLTKTRRAYIQQRWREDLTNLEAWRAYFEKVRQSKFLTGKAECQNGRAPFLANLAWLVKPENYAKVCEGNYSKDFTFRKESPAERSARRAREIFAKYGEPE